MRIEHPRPLNIVASVAAMARDTRGNMSVVAFCVFVLLAAVLSLSVDAGTLYVAKRKLQAVVDAAVLKAVTDPANAATLVANVVDANGVASQLSGPPLLQWGRFPPTGYTMDTVGALPVEQRFEPGAANPNALRVTLSTSPRLFLSRLFFDHTVPVTARAIAANRPLAQLSIRSYLLAFDSTRSAALNALLSSYLGTSVSLSAVGYNGLLSGDIRLIGFLDALATTIGVSVGDPNMVLQENVTFGDIADAVIAEIGADPNFSGDVATITATLLLLKSALVGVPPFDLNDVFLLDAENPRNAGAARVNLLDFLVASGEAANSQNGGTTEVSTPIAGGVARMRAAVIEPSQISAIGGVGLTVETAQVRLFIEIDPTQVLSLAGIDFDIRLPLLVEIGKGTATINNLSCPTPSAADGQVGVTASSGAVELSAVDIDVNQLGAAIPPVTQPASIVSVLGVLTVSATGQVSFGSGSSNLGFTAPFDANNYQTVSTATPVQNAATSLFGGLSYNVSVLGLPLITPPMVLAALQPIVTGIAPAVDGLLDRTIEALGVRVGNTDVGVTYLRCSNPVLTL